MPCHIRSCRPVLGVFFCNTMENLQEIIEALSALKDRSETFALVLWGAWLLKRYVINGTVDRYFEEREQLRKIMLTMSKQISVLTKTVERGEYHVRDCQNTDLSNDNRRG